ncbi:dynein light chain roadblock-type, partial [Tremellales sp. Uapishka_1]
MSTLEPLPNGHAPETQPPPEIEATLARLSAYRNVRGVMILSRTGGIIQSHGTVFEGESGKKYARALGGMVKSVQGAVGECDQGDELKFMRIRTKRHELIITPDERYLLVVLQDPGQ